MEDLNLTIEAWLDKFENGRLPRGDEERIEAFMILLKTLKDRGDTKESIPQVRRAVLKACTYETHKRLAAWMKVLEKLFNKAVVRIWTQEFSELTEEEKNPEKFKLTPQAPRSDNTEVEPEEVPRFGKELDRSIFSKTPTPEVQVDEELSEMLGFNSDE